MAFWEPRSAALTVRRILKVNHAGEFGAIRIYSAQLTLARRLYPDIVPAPRLPDSSPTRHNQACPLH